jgi:predicted amidohydrolase YtcJ
MNPMNDGTRVRWRAGAAVAALAATAVLAAACGGSGSAPATAAQTAYQKAVAFSVCMRAHGEPGFPDPQPNGNLLIDGQKDHLNGALMPSAQKTCQHLLPKYFPLTAAQQQKLTAQALNFTACMRSHGIAGMADPVVSATGISQRIPNGFSPNSPVFQARSEPVRSSGLGGHRDEQRCLLSKHQPGGPGQPDLRVQAGRLPPVLSSLSSRP